MQDDLVTSAPAFAEFIIGRAFRRPVGSCVLIELLNARFAPLVAGFRLPRDHSIGFPDRAAFVASSLQAFVGDLCPELL